jgi:hypothetical protein
MYEYHFYQTNLLKKYPSEFRQNFHIEITEYLFLCKVLVPFFKWCQLPSHMRSRGHFVDITGKHEIKKNKCGVASDDITLVIMFMKIFRLSGEQTHGSDDTTAQWS